MILMTSIIGVFANCNFMSFFLNFSPFLWLSLTKVMSYWLLKDFLVNLFLKKLVTSEWFLRRLKLFGLKNVDGFMNFASLFIFFVLSTCYLVSLMKSPICCVVNKKLVCVKLLSDCFLTLLLGAFKFRSFCRKEFFSRSLINGRSSALI